MRITKDNINGFIKGTIMNCYNMDITKIDYVPEGITHLDCSNNKLTKLPNLPNNFKYLYCSYNELTELPKLPESLKYLYCVANNLPYKITINNIKEHNKIIRRKQILSKICV